MKHTADWDVGFQAGYTQGRLELRAEWGAGYVAGQRDGLLAGRQGSEQRERAARSEGYQKGRRDGLESLEGFAKHRDEGWAEGYKAGRIEGFDAGRLYELERQAKDSVEGLRPATGPTSQPYGSYCVGRWTGGPGPCP